MKKANAACVFVVLLFTGCASQMDAPGGLLTGAFLREGTSPAARAGAIRPGSDWQRVGALTALPCGIGKDPEVTRLTPLVRKDPRTHLPRLVKALVAGAADDFERARALHDWIALNIAYDGAAFRGESAMVTEPYAVIGRGASVCQGYAEAYALLCSIAGLECRVVSGFARGYGFDPFGERDRPYAENHAWNAVRIGSEWYLVDVTWDAGGYDGARFTFSYATGYLFTRPDVFICTHFPGDPRWQLLEKAVSYGEFASLPYLRGDFGGRGFQRPGDARMIATVRGGVELLFHASADPRIHLQAALQPYGASGPSRTCQALVRQEGDEIRVKVLFPGAGRYLLSLMAGTDDEAASLSYLGALYFESLEGTDLRLPFISPEFTSSGMRLDAENGYAGRVDGAARFSFTYEGEASIMVMDAAYATVGNASNVQRDGGRYTVALRFPSAGDYSVSIMVPTKGRANATHSVASLDYTSLSASGLRFPSLEPDAVSGGLTMEAQQGYESSVGAEARAVFSFHGKASAGLYDADQKPVKGRVLLQREGDRWEALAAFPRPGAYTLWIFIPKTDTPSTYGGVASLSYVAREGIDREYPSIDSSAGERGFRVIAPLDGRVRAGQSVTFEVAGPAGSDASLAMANKRVPMKWDGGRFTATVRAEGTAIDIFFTETGNGTSRWLARYEVR
jgi:hypothetical protein